MRKREKNLRSEAEDRHTETTKQIIYKNTFTFFNFVFVVLAVLLLFAGSYHDMAFLFIAALNSVIGIVQQLRSQAELDKLKVISETKVKVIRNGKKKEISHHELIKGDLVQLAAGSQIPADGTIVKGMIQVNEALLTGEADLIRKKWGQNVMRRS